MLNVGQFSMQIMRVSGSVFGANQQLSGKLDCGRHFPFSLAPISMIDYDKSLLAAIRECPVQIRIGGTRRNQWRRAGIGGASRNWHGA